jgi:hypothetical protein
MSRWFVAANIGELFAMTNELAQMMVVRVHAQARDAVHARR